MLLTGNPWVDGLFRIPERTPDRESPTILFAPTYNPEISAAGFFSGRLVDMVRRVYPESRVIIKPHPSILQYDHPYVARYRALFRRWVDDWRAEASKPGVTFVDDPGANISDYYGDADILVGVGGNHLPTRQDLALDIQFRPLAFDPAKCDRACGTTALNWMCGIRCGNILFGQVEIGQGGTQSTIEELGLVTHFPLLGARWP